MSSTSDRAQPRLRAARQTVYTNPALLAEEQARIFDQEWVFIARAGALEQPGDYVTARLGRKPVIVIRQDDGSIRAFANYCLHRYTRLLDGCGNAQRIVCPYHAWTYDVSGALIGITESAGFCDVDKKDMHLEELACEEWHGFVFVAIRKDLSPVAKRLEGLLPYVERYGLGSFDDRYATLDELWDGNWKLVFENFVECYHVTYAHKQSIGPTNPTNLAELGPRDERHFSIHHNPYRVEDYPEIHNEKLNSDERRRLHVIGIYPNLLIAIDPNFIWWMMLEPLAVDRTNARWGLSFSPEAMAGMADPDGYAQTIHNVIRTATDEDKVIVARVQEGTEFGAASVGYLHNELEIYVDEFRRYVERMMKN